MNGFNIIAVIPARGGSQSIPKKNIIDFCGKPPIAWSIEHALGSEYIDEVYVSSDSKEILDVAEENGAVRKLRNDGADSLFSSSKFGDFFIWEQRSEGLNSLNFDFKERARRQNVKPQYVENGSIYIFKPKFYVNIIIGLVAILLLMKWSSGRHGR